MVYVDDLQNVTTETSKRYYFDLTTAGIRYRSELLKAKVLRIDRDSVSDFKTGYSKENGDAKPRISSFERSTGSSSIRKLSCHNV